MIKIEFGENTKELYFNFNDRKGNPIRCEELIN
ncbi:MAG: hypothetical protein ACD_79C00102G0002 [uncultured bacterium]|nr:MAG: hypothetical protein ACD_79C00102G0002 [uncultured bacterium]